MTREQRKTLEFIGASLAGNGVPPSFDEIAAHLGLKSKSGVNRLVTALQDRRMITYMRSRARSISLTEAGRLALQPAGGYAVKLSPEIDTLVTRYARSNHVTVETVIREAVRAYVGAAG